MNIGTKMGNINGENIRMNYINANHLVLLYDGVKPAVNIESENSIQNNMTMIIIESDSITNLS